MTPARTLLIMVILAATLVLAACGGPKKEEWVASVSALCTSFTTESETMARQVVASGGTEDPSKMKIIQASVPQLQKHVASVRAVPAPEDDAAIAAYLAEGDKFASVFQQFAAALAASNMTGLQQLAPQLQASVQTFNASVAAAGLPTNCGAEQS
ncbi:MAG: hypothetical protein JWM86_447 [Thermoleophilia bacterium]|nr:hypothetical protein [Thermoleophilia bacterium]